VVIQGVRGRDTAAPKSKGGLPEELVTRMSASLFQANLHVLGHRWHVGPSGHERDALIGAKRFAELCFNVGFWPLAVVKVGCYDIESGFVH